MFEIYNKRTEKTIKGERYESEEEAKNQLKYLDYVFGINGIYQKDEFAIREVKDE